MTRDGKENYYVLAAKYNYFCFMQDGFTGNVNNDGISNSALRTCQDAEYLRSLAIDQERVST